MRRDMTREEATSFQERWKLVNEREIEELRATSMEVKMRQLATMMFSVSALGWSERMAEQDEAVRQRWILLKEQYLASQK